MVPLSLLTSLLCLASPAWAGLGAHPGAVPLSADSLAAAALSSAAPSHAVLSANLSSSLPLPIVESSIGQLVGFSHVSSSGASVRVWLGVPYAAPPVGRLRFEKPQPPLRLHSPLSADSFGAGCIPHTAAAMREDTEYSEDCLKLNVIAPAEDVQAPPGGFPILFYVHGGGFLIGNSGQYGFAPFADFYAADEEQPLIVVHFHYRLGPLGFLSLGVNSELLGNLGLYDQAAALKFVYDNAESFGGNKQRITVWGVSAGAVSASLLALSPATKDMIASTIEMSGTAAVAWAAHEQVVTHSRDFLAAFNCSSSGVALKECLKHDDEATFIQRLFNAVETIGTAPESLNFVKFGPVVDGDFLPGPPAALLASAAAPRKPALIGANSHEAIYFTIYNRAATIHRLGLEPSELNNFNATIMKDKMDMLLSEWIPAAEERDELIDEAVLFYRSRHEKESNRRIALLTAYSEFVSDFTFNLGVSRAISSLAVAGGDVFVYFLEHFSPDLFNESSPVRGAQHINEMPYIMDFHGLGRVEWTAVERRMRRRMQEAIRSFVYHDRPVMSDVSWPSVSSASCSPFLRLQTADWLLEERVGLFEESSEFWRRQSERFHFDFVSLSPRHSQVASSSRKSSEEL